MALAPSYKSSADTPLQAMGVWSPPPVAIEATITLGQTASNAVEIQGKMAVLYVPVGMAGADLTFLGGPTEATCTSPIFDKDVLRTIPAAQVVAGRALALDWLDWVGFNWIKLLIPAAQAAERKFTLSLVI